MKICPLLLALVLLLLVTMCSFQKWYINLPDAVISKNENGYVLTLRGLRQYMNHDPVSFIKRFVSPTYYETVENFQIPRDVGKIDGKEIPMKKGHYGLLGTITISGLQAEVNLRIDDTDNHVERPSIWNGKYHLQKNY